MRTLRIIDSPWRRLPWTLPTALLVWTIALWGLAFFMEKPSHWSVEPPPIDAQLIDLPVPAVPPNVQTKRPATVRQPKPLPLVRPQQAPVMPQVIPRAAQTPAVQTPAVQTPEVTTNASNNAARKEVQTTASGGNTAPNNSPQTASYNGKGSPQGNLYANSGARAIFQPRPQIPDDLRSMSFKLSARARFNIAADGSVKVELIKPTPNPRLNRILLDSLRKWRFIPAIKNGAPVASSLEMDFKMEVN